VEKITRLAAALRVSAMRDFSAERYRQILAEAQSRYQSRIREPGQTYTGMCAAYAALVAELEDARKRFGYPPPSEPIPPFPRVETH
jgi:hypothetical protein